MSIFKFIKVYGLRGWFEEQWLHIRPRLLEARLKYLNPRKVKKFYRNVEVNLPMIVVIYSIVFCVIMIITAFMAFNEVNTYVNYCSREVINTK